MRREIACYPQGRMTFNCSLRFIKQQGNERNLNNYGFSGEFYSLEYNNMELERWQMLNMCKQHSAELFGNLQGIFLGPDKIQSVCPCSRKWWWQSAKVSCMCLTETFLSSNVNKTKLAEYAKQACLYATGYYSRRLPHTNFATNSRGISLKVRASA